MNTGFLTVSALAWVYLTACANAGNTSTLGEGEPVCAIDPSSSEIMDELQLRKDAAAVWRSKIGLTNLDSLDRVNLPIPLVRVPPTFPARASQCGFGGHCTMIFDIDSDGVPANVLAACTSDLFEINARMAVSRFKFSPLTIDGEPEFFQGAMTSIQFELDSSY